MEFLKHSDISVNALTGKFVALTPGFRVVGSRRHGQNQDELAISVGEIDDYHQMKMDELHLKRFGKSMPRRLRVPCLDDKNIDHIHRTIEETNTRGLRRATFVVSVTWAFKHKLHLVAMLTGLEGSYPKCFRVHLLSGAEPLDQIVSVSNCVLENTSAIVQIDSVPETHPIVFLLSWLGARHGFDRVELISYESIDLCTE